MSQINPSRVSINTKSALFSLQTIFQHSACVFSHPVYSTEITSRLFVHHSNIFFLSRVVLNCAHCKKIADVCDITAYLFILQFRRIILFLYIVGIVPMRMQDTFLKKWSTMLKLPCNCRCCHKNYRTVQKWYIRYRVHPINILVPWSASLLLYKHTKSRRDLQIRTLGFTFMAIRTKVDCLENGCSFGFRSLGGVTGSVLFP